VYLASNDPNDKLWINAINENARAQMGTTVDLQNQFISEKADDARMNQFVAEFGKPGK